jgi:hypothetical protein
MRKISLFVLIFSFIAIFSMPLSAAGTTVGAAPATKGFCGGLKAPGITPGLYGLCVAYCEAGANSERVLDNYNRKRTGSDPAMPCLEVKAATLDCVCWNTLTMEDIGVGQGPVYCALDPSSKDFIFYGNASTSEFLSASDGACMHYTSATDNLVSMQDLSWEQENECRLEILDLAARDFDGFCG